MTATGKKPRWPETDKDEHMHLWRYRPDAGRGKSDTDRQKKSTYQARNNPKNNTHADITEIDQTCRREQEKNRKHKLVSISIKFPQPKHTEQTHRQSWTQRSRARLQT